jgi:hypothetical protein
MSLVLPGAYLSAESAEERHAEDAEKLFGEPLRFSAVKKNGKLSL